MSEGCYRLCAREELNLPGNGYDKGKRRASRPAWGIRGGSVLFHAVPLCGVFPCLAGGCYGTGCLRECVGAGFSAGVGLGSVAGWACAWRVGCLRALNGVVAWKNPGRYRYDLLVRGAPGWGVYPPMRSSLGAASPHRRCDCRTVGARGALASGRDKSLPPPDEHRC